jgi:hypothetical protein
MLLQAATSPHRLDLRSAMSPRQARLQAVAIQVLSAYAAQ